MITMKKKTVRTYVDDGDVALDLIRGRQRSLQASMRNHRVRHPSDLPIRVLLSHRAARLAGKESV